MPKRVQDLSPFFAERCRLTVLFASRAPTGVVLRRGPTQWWHVTLWDLRKDRFQSGQWFHGRIYPEKCDVSPDGKLFLYFGGKFRSRDVETGYGIAYTAVSRPPYLTALALWPHDSTYGGGGLFVDDRTVVVYPATHHRDHQPGPLTVVEYSAQKHAGLQPSSGRGWSGVLTSPGTSRFAALRKQCGDRILEQRAGGSDCPPRRPHAFSLYRAGGEPIVNFEAHWADFDANGRLLATIGGRILWGEAGRKSKFGWYEVASLHEEQPVRLVAPDWAQHW
jgi:hypothetical protein